MFIELCKTTSLFVVHQVCRLLQEIAPFMRVLGSYPLDEMAAMANSLDNGAVQTLKRQMMGGNGVTNTTTASETEAAESSARSDDSSELPEASTSSILGQV